EPAKQQNPEAEAQVKKQRAESLIAARKAEIAGGNVMPPRDADKSLEALKNLYSGKQVEPVSIADPSNPQFVVDGIAIPSEVNHSDDKDVQLYIELHQAVGDKALSYYQKAHGKELNNKGEWVL